MPDTAVREALLRARAAIDDALAAAGLSTPVPPSTTSGLPSDVLDLRNWTIMRPTGTSGSPDNGYFLGRSIPGTFYVEDGAVVFAAPAGGVHSSGSKYARCEARQMVDAKGTKASWSSSGTHSLECDLAIDVTGLTKRKRIAGMQIHDDTDDVCQLMCDGNRLGLVHNDGKSFELIDDHYAGQRFTCRITTTSDRITVSYSGKQVVDVPKKGTGWYWKMGCYLQTDAPNWGEDPKAIGRVKIWRYALVGGAR